MQIGPPVQVPHQPLFASLPLQDWVNDPTRAKATAEALTRDTGRAAGSRPLSCMHVQPR